jgi:putative phosphoesterase
MKVALIGDVHANLPALEAVLAHAHQRGVERIWNVGDFVGYGAFPDEVVRRLGQEHALSIVGNYDLKVLKFKKKQDKWRKSKHPVKFLAFQWAHDHLSRESRKHLRSLPREIRLQAEGLRILLTHGSPASDEEPLTPGTPEEHLRELARMADADVIICGHSHQPFAREVDGVWFINTGSVGRPDDGDPRACYAILQVGPELLQVRHYRVEYDVERAVAAIRERKLPEVFARMTLRGRNLDAVLQAALVPVICRQQIR